MMKFTAQSTLFIILSFLLFFSALVSPSNAQYYGSYGLYGSYGGLYGGYYGGLYGSSLYGGYYGGYYGSSLYGGLYGGLYGSSLYGGYYGSSLYGSSYGGLYGSRLYGGYYGGLYGSSLYGGYYGGYYGSGLYGGLYGGSYGGLYGSRLYGGYYGGLYGSSLYGGYYGGYYGSGLYGGLYGNLYGLSGLRYGLAEQTGLWQGIWSIGTASGSMTLNLVEDPAIPGVLTGYVQLIGNTTLPSLISLTGEILNDQIILTGDNGLNGGAFVVIDVSGILISPTDMEGEYILTSGTGTVIETGQFQVTLTTPVI
ncbi:MAG: hypothetical protein ACMUJM_06650 [bacterium]